MTEDDASECDSDSSITNKRTLTKHFFSFHMQTNSQRFIVISGSNNTNTEMLGDESPSRMRTRNKQSKDQTSNKRPKRGADIPDATNENPKTPTKAERRKSTKDTPTKGKKRTNIDLDMDNDGSDEKEKRKRVDVSFYFIELSTFIL